MKFENPNNKTIQEINQINLLITILEFVCLGVAIAVYFVLTKYAYVGGLR